MFMENVIRITKARIKLWQSEGVISYPNKLPAVVSANQLLQ